MRERLLTYFKHNFDQVLQWVLENGHPVLITLPTTVRGVKRKAAIIMPYSLFDQMDKQIKDLTVEVEDLKERLRDAI